MIYSGNVISSVPVGYASLTKKSYDAYVNSLTLKYDCKIWDRFKIIAILDMQKDIRHTVFY